MNPHTWPSKNRTTDQHEHTFSNYVRIRDVVQKTCQRRWTIRQVAREGQGYPCYQHDMMMMIYLVALSARISLTLSRHHSLSSIASGRSTGLHPFANLLRIVPSAPITIGITVTFMFHRCFSYLARSRYLSLFSLSVDFILWSIGMTVYYLTGSLFWLTFTRSNRTRTHVHSSVYTHVRTYIFKGIGRIFSFFVLFVTIPR